MSVLVKSCFKSLSSPPSSSLDIFLLKTFVSIVSLWTFFAPVFDTFASRRRWLRNGLSCRFGFSLGTNEAKRAFLVGRKTNDWKKLLLLSLELLNNVGVNTDTDVDVDTVADNCFFFFFCCCCCSQVNVSVTLLLTTIPLNEYSEPESEKKTGSLKIDVELVPRNVTIRFRLRS